MTKSLTVSEVLVIIFILRLGKFPASLVGNIPDFCVYKLFFVFDFVSFLFSIIYTSFKTKNVSAILMHPNNALYVLLGYENRPLIWYTLLIERYQIPYAVYYSILTNVCAKQQEL